MVVEGAGEWDVHTRFWCSRASPQRGPTLQPVRDSLLSTQKSAHASLPLRPAAGGVPSRKKSSALASLWGT